MRDKITVDRKNRMVICIVVILCCGLLALVDGYWKPAYGVKAGIKVLLFFVVPLVCTWCLGRKNEEDRQDLQQKEKIAEAEHGAATISLTNFLAVFQPDRKALTLGLGLGAVTMSVILGGYALLAPYLDLSAIPAAMASNGGITADNFLYVGTWIALCNSLMEEIFFRGFSFLQLCRVSSRKFAYIVSGAAFALYHAAIVDGWVSPILFLLMLAALFVCGLFFDWLDEKRGRIWVSWLMHMCANVAINLIGMRLLGMI